MMANEKIHIKKIKLKIIIRLKKKMKINAVQCSSFDGKAHQLKTSYKDCKALAI